MRLLPSQRACGGARDLFDDARRERRDALLARRPRAARVLARRGHLLGDAVRSTSRALNAVGRRALRRRSAQSSIPRERVEARACLPLRLRATWFERAARARSVAAVPGRPSALVACETPLVAGALNSQSLAPPSLAQPALPSVSPVVLKSGQEASTLALQSETNAKRLPDGWSIEPARSKPATMRCITHRRGTARGAISPLPPDSARLRWRRDCWRCAASFGGSGSPVPIILVVSNAVEWRSHRRHSPPPLPVARRALRTPHAHAPQDLWLRRHDHSVEPRAEVSTCSRPWVWPR